MPCMVGRLDLCLRDDFVEQRRAMKTTSILVKASSISSLAVASVAPIVAVSMISFAGPANHLGNSNRMSICVKPSCFSASLNFLFHIIKSVDESSCRGFSGLALSNALRPTSLARIWSLYAALSKNISRAGLFGIWTWT